MPCRRCEKEPCNANNPVACTQRVFRVLQLEASSGLPALRGARPNPSLKRSANGSPPGPACGEVAFSTVRAWRATVVSRLAHTLGLTENLLCGKSVKAAPATQSAPAGAEAAGIPVDWSLEAAHRRACETLKNTMPSGVCVAGAALTDLAQKRFSVRPNV